MQQESLHSYPSQVVVRLSSGLKLSLLLLAVCLSCGCDSQSGSNRPATIPDDPRPVPDGPNLIVISIDTLRPDHLGCYGYDRPTSPALDRLAREGLLFENVSSTSPWTMPAHASLLTGLYPSRHGLKSHKQYLQESAVPLAEILQQQGYVTSAVVNSHYISQRYGFDRGFDDFYYVRENMAQAKPSDVESGAVSWLSKHDGRPFFLFLHYYDVHSDYRSLPEYERMFVRDYIGPVDGSTKQLIAYRRGKEEISFNQPDIDRLIDLYDAGIRQMDDGIARLIRVLEKNDLLDNTLIVVTSDHGEEFLEHGSVLHGKTHFEELIRVPLILHGPGLPSGHRIKKVASLVDVLPTMLGMLGVASSRDVDGLNLASYWSDDSPDTTDRLVFSEADHNNEHPDMKRAVRRGKFKLHFNRVTREAELFNLDEDPDELKDVASEYPSVAERLLLELSVFETTHKPGKTLAPLTEEEVERLKSLGYLQ